MKKTATLEKICELISNEELDYSKIIKELTNRELVDTNKEMHLEFYQQQISEMHLSLVLQDLSLYYGFFTKPLDGICSKDFQIETDSLGRVLIYKDRKQLVEYDNLILLKKLPVVFEIKTGKPMAGFFDKNNRNPMKVENILKKLDPISNLYSRDVGYVIFLPKDVHKSMASHSSAYNFVGINGLVYSMPFTRSDFKEEITYNLEKNNLKIKKKKS